MAVKVNAMASYEATCTRCQTLIGYLYSDTVHKQFPDSPLDRRYVQCPTCQNWVMHDKKNRRGYSYMNT